MFHRHWSTPEKPAVFGFSDLDLFLHSPKKAKKNFGVVEKGGISP
jgi:hypothetical protein